MDTITFIIFIPFLMALVIPMIYKKFSKVHIGWIVMSIPFILFILLLQYIPHISKGKAFLNTLNWIPTYDLALQTYVDGLSLIFGFIITGIGTLVVLYSIYYLSKEESLKHFYIYLLLFMGGMLGVVFLDHLMVLYVFWEITSISSFLLIAFWFQRKGSRYGAKKALLITITGGLFMFLGFLMVHQMTGTFSIREMIAQGDSLVNHQLSVPAMILILLGAFTKSAQFPFHIWLPDAMEAPTPISAYLHSATMVKAGIYLVTRLTPLFGGHAVWFWLVSGIGIFTLFWGSFQAIRQTDLKALLAFSTVSQLGLIMSLMGIGSIAYHPNIQNAILFTQATFTGLFHLMNHATFKGALFMVIGIVDFQMGTRDLRRIGGLIALMPVSFAVALIGSFSMAGLPPFNGFLSKEMFFTAMLYIQEQTIFSLEMWGILFPIIAWTASILTFVYCMIIVFKTFLGERRGHLLEPSYEAPKGMLIAPVILASLVLLIFFFPNSVGDYFIYPAMVSIFSPEFAPESLQLKITLWQGFNQELWMTIGVVVIGSLLYIALKYWKRIYRLFPEKLSIDTLYHRGLDKVESIAKKATSTYMTGHLSTYLIYIYVIFIAMIGGIFVRQGIIPTPKSLGVEIGVFEWILTTVIIIAAFSVVLAKGRLQAILLNGLVGFSIAMFYVIFRAPDLALTQIVVETATTALFLLCFYFLPEWKKEREKSSFSLTNFVISIGTGLTFILIALAVRAENLFDSISSYFENALELAGGRNIVNTILGDFRAFDTMLEIVVLFISGLGVYSLIKIRKRKGARNIEE